MGRANDTKRSSSTVYSDGADHGASSFSSTIPLLNQVPVEDDDPPAYTDVIPEGHVRRNDLETNEIRCGKTQKNGRGSTRTVLSRSITSNPELLQDFVAAEARLMPNPLVRMMGTHTETRFRDKREETNTVTDFDITLSAADLLALPWRRTRIIENGVKAYRGTRTRSIGSSFKADVETTRPTPSLQEWCHRFCASSASLKTFTISRRVINRDDKYLTDALTGVLRSTNYRGRIDITFPVDDRKTTLMSDHPINRYRTNPFVWWICVILQLWIITWPLLWLTTKHWEVVYVNWPCRIFATAEGQWPNADEESPRVIHEGRRPDGWDARRDHDVRLAAMSEMSWVSEWRGAIVRAAEDRWQGTLSPADKHAARDAEQRNAERAWETTQTANAAAQQGGIVGATIGLFRGASDVLRESRLSRGWGRDT